VAFGNNARVADDGGHRAWRVALRRHPDGRNSNIIDQDLPDGRSVIPDATVRPPLFTTAHQPHRGDFRVPALDDRLDDIGPLAAECLAPLIEDRDRTHGHLLADRLTEDQPALLGATSCVLVGGRVGCHG
jgi:hypothetical protein